MSECAEGGVQPEGSLLERLAMRESGDVADDEVDLDGVRVTLPASEL